MIFRNVSGYFESVVSFTFISTSKGRKEIGMVLYNFCGL